MQPERRRLCIGVFLAGKEGEGLQAENGTCESRAGNSMVSSENSVYHCSIMFGPGPGEGGRGQVTQGFEHSIKEFGPYPVGTGVLFRNF